MVPLSRSEQINEWGSSFDDRKDSYDDSSDIQIFTQMVNHHHRDEKDLMVQSPPLLRTYFQKELNLCLGEENSFRLQEKPNGPFGVDMSIEVNQQMVATLDLERSGPWDTEWPSYYRCISFLSRKEKFLNQYKDLPFFMVYLNKSRNKVLIVNKKDILKFPTIGTRFKKGKGFGQGKKEIDYSCGNLFGSNTTLLEEKIFNKY